MNRGNFIAGLAGPARAPVLELRSPIEPRTIVLHDNMAEGWLAKVIARNRRRTLQLLWPDRTPAGTIFPSSGGKRAPSLAQKKADAGLRPAPAPVCEVPRREKSETSTGK
jgi:hypothetical protein